MKRSMSWMRSLSTRSRATARGPARNSTSRMWPVRPMPPTVARNRSAFSSRRALHDAPVGHAHAQPQHVGAEAAVAVVVLAVHVGRHHAAQRDELRAGRDGREEAAGQEEPVDLAQREAGLRAQRRRSPGSKARMRSASAAAATTGWLRRRQRRVAVGAAQAAAEHGVARERLEVLRADLAAGHGHAAPAGELGSGSPTLRSGAQRRGSSARPARRRSARPRCRWA